MLPIGSVGMAMLLSSYSDYTISTLYDVIAPALNVYQ
jgi:hypothetical protein